MQPCVFIDRDGVLIEDRGYMHKLEDLVFLPGAIAALQELKRLGFLLICVTNQSGIARGMFTRSEVDVFQEHMLQQLETANAGLDGIYLCPHHPQGKIPELAIVCDCRKPDPGLIHRAERDFAIDMPRSFLVGDKDSDVECARNAGIGAIRVRSNQYEQKSQADFSCASLREAVAYIRSRT